MSVESCFGLCRCCRLDAGGDGGLCVHVHRCGAVILFVAVVDG